MPTLLSSLTESSTFAPFRTRVFRNLWLASFAANIGMWMNDVTAAWVMTSLTTSPVMVAMVQTASTLPVFMLGLPSGALADIIDRRRYFAATQLWVALTALLLAALALTGTLTAPLLLALTFANGIGLAMRWPVFSAIVPEVVPREHLGSAMALNGISMNLSRVVGPVVAGAIIAAAGSGVVFVLNVVLAVAAFATILRWRSSPRTSTLPGERFVGAMRVGWQHVMQSPRMKVVLVRIFFFFLHSSALLALLPLVARELHGAGPGTYTLMLACIGGGAVVAAFYFPRWRARFNRDQFVVIGTLAHAAMSVIVVFAPNIWVALPAIVVLGMAWISTANSLTLAAQVALPNWVRARGMAIYQMALMGGAAAGSLLWGQVAGFEQRAHRRLRRGGGRPAAVAADAAAERGGRRRPRFQPGQAQHRRAAGDRHRARRRPGDGDGGIPDRPGRCRRLCRGDAEDTPRSAAPGRAVVGAVP